jgi:hypothetical protein
MAALPIAAEEKPPTVSDKTVGVNDRSENKWMDLINRLRESKITEQQCIGKKIEWTAVVLSKNSESNSSAIALDLNQENKDFFHGAYCGADLTVSIPLNESVSILEKEHVKVKGTISEIRSVPRWIEFIWPNGEKGRGSAIVYLIEIENPKIETASK